MRASSGRPPHLISRADVANWLADSAVKTVTYHRTSENALRDILDRGIRVGTAQVGTYGLGFYSSTEPEPFYGDAEISVAVRLHNPLVGSADEVGELVDRLTRRFSPLDLRISRAVAQQVRREIMSWGHDGMIIHDAGGDGVDWIIAFEGAAVRVVVDW